MRENPIHIINVSIKSADTEDDDALVTAFSDFAQSKVSLLSATASPLHPCLSFPTVKIDPLSIPLQEILYATTINQPHLTNKPLLHSSDEVNVVIYVSVCSINIRGTWSSGVLFSQLSCHEHRDSTLTVMKVSERVF